MLLATILTLAFAPAVPACGCSCIIRADAPQEYEHEIVFLATVLDVERTTHYRVKSARLLVHQVWRGEVGDTITIGVSGGCKHYEPGGQYLIGGDPPGEGGLLLPQGCGSIPYGSSVYRDALDHLGDPRRTYADPRQGSLGTQIVPVGSAPPPGRGVRVQIVLLDSVRVAQVLLADQPASMLAGSAIFTVPEGLYELRLILEGGAVFSTVLSAHCDELWSRQVIVSPNIGQADTLRSRESPCRTLHHVARTPWSPA